MAISSALLEKKFVARSVLIVLGAAAAAYAGFAIFLSPPAEFPAPFLSAWQEAGQVSARIVQLTGDTNGIMREVNALDVQRNIAQALALIARARANNQEAYGQVTLLTENLQRLTESLRGLPSEESQQVAYEAVAAELSLISEFILYTGDFDTFLSRVERAVATNGAEDRRAVEDILDRVNARVRKINDLNVTFLASIRSAREAL